MKHYETAYAKVKFVKDYNLSQISLQNMRIKDFDKYYQDLY